MKDYIFMLELIEKAEYSPAERHSFANSESWIQIQPMLATDPPHHPTSLWAVAMGRRTDTVARPLRQSRGVPPKPSPRRGLRRDDP